MNPLTPFPMERTIMVALPYRAYPAPTSSLPLCRASFSVAGPSSFCKVKEDLYYGEYKFWKLITIDSLLNSAFEPFFIES